MIIACPICDQAVKESNINLHIDSVCKTQVENASAPNGQLQNGSTKQYSSLFKTPANSIVSALWPATIGSDGKELKTHEKDDKPAANIETVARPSAPTTTNKRPAPSASLELDESTLHPQPAFSSAVPATNGGEPPVKRAKTGSSAPSALHRAQPLAERMRPRTLDEIQGQDLLAENGVLRGLIESDRVPSLILWGHPGTGKTTIARLMAHQTGARFIELNSTSTGVGELKKIFTESKNELSLTGRKTMVFCDEIHRFSKSQQDVFLGPVEAGIITLIGATTENPSFKVVNALLSRCRVFPLHKLGTEDIARILARAVSTESSAYSANPTLLDTDLLHNLASYADGDARTALNLLEQTMSLSSHPSTTKENLKTSLATTLLYDRAGDQHYDAISAFHKSIRGSDPNASLYYLTRMLASGEDPLYIARRMIVIASEDIGLADSSLLPLATATYAAASTVGMPEARINLAHCAVALALAPKSVRVYRALSAVTAALEEPGVAGLPIPLHLRNAPTRLMKEMGYGRAGGYKYNPDFVGGRCKQSYFPAGMEERGFLGEGDLGEMWDEDLEGEEGEEGGEGDVDKEGDEFG